MLDRYRFILLKVFWEGVVSRQEVMDRFGISPAQATNDFHKTRKNYPDAVLYEPAVRRYIPGTAISKYVENLSFDEYFSTCIKESKYVHIISSQPRPIPPESYRVINQAIQFQKGISFHYYSMKDPNGLKTRTVYPHSVLRSGFRWHIRGHEEESGMFKDFNISRIKNDLEIVGTGSEISTIQHDDNWNELVTLSLIPNPRFSDEQKAVIEADHGMNDGVLQIKVRAATLLYTLHLYELRDFGHNPPLNQFLAIGNMDELKEYLVPFGSN